MNGGSNIFPLTPSDDLTVFTAPALRRTLDKLQLSGVRYLVLNMEHVDYVDSAGMAVIFAAVRRMREEGGQLMLVNVTPAVARALKIYRLVDVVPVREKPTEKSIPKLSANALPIWRTTLPVAVDDLQNTRERIYELASRLEFTSDEKFDLMLAAGEALGNAADHTCGEGILTTVIAYDDRMVIEVSDCGDGFDPTACAETSPCEDRGRGLRLMRLLVDDVSIVSRPMGNGTVVRLEKLMSQTDVEAAGEEGEHPILDAELF